MYFFIFCSNVIFCQQIYHWRPGFRPSCCNLSTEKVFKGMFSGLMLYFVNKNTIHMHVFVFIPVYILSASTLFKATFRLYVGILSAVTIFTDIFSALRPIIIFCHQIHYSKTCFLLYICILWAVTLFKVMFTVLLLFFCQQLHYSK